MMKKKIPIFTPRFTKNSTNISYAICTLIVHSKLDNSSCARLFKRNYAISSVCSHNLDIALQMPQFPKFRTKLTLNIFEWSFVSTFILCVFCVDMSR